MQHNKKGEAVSRNKIYSRYLRNDFSRKKSKRVYIAISSRRRAIAVVLVSTSNFR
jgi:hypothetical protein